VPLVLTLLLPGEAQAREPGMVGCPRHVLERLPCFALNVALWLQMTLASAKSVANLFR
jgi:hypothetical protein